MNSDSLINHKKLESKPLFGLYIIATPIGNLEDISVRAANLLINLDYIYAEDSSKTIKILNYLHNNRSIKIYNEQSSANKRKEIIELIKAGNSVGLVSDAGTPLISDPGYKLVKEIYENNLNIFPIPGPSSITTALSCSPLPTDNFTFLGFPPRKSDALKNYLKNLKTQKNCFIFFESSHRILFFLRELASIFPEQKLFLARELTKLHEEKLYGTTKEIYEKLQNKILKGEFVILLYNDLSNKNVIFTNDLIKVIEIGIKYLSVKDLSKFLSEISDLTKKEIYNLAIEKTDERN
jgi:16S rRNA (cytidine1402-2'-O)-methyltransferase